VIERTPEEQAAHDAHFRAICAKLGHQWHYGWYYGYSGPPLYFCFICSLEQQECPDGPVLYKIPKPA
jgi:hypothetical protein